MEHHCSLCAYFAYEVDHLVRHLQRRHKGCTNFMVHCSVCGTSFRNVNSFRRHYYRKHFRNTSANSGLTEVQESSEDCMDLGLGDSIGSMSKSAEGVYLLRLKAGHRLSDSAVNDVMSATTELILNKCKVLTSRLRESGVLTDSLETEICSSLTVFNGLETSYKQEQFYEKHFSLVKPVAAKLGLRQIMQKNEGNCVCVSKAVFGYYVSFLNQLTALLSMPEVYRSVLYPSTGTQHLMTDVTDGYAFDSPLPQNHLLFSLYSDDFEVVNPIGTHRKTHKITVFYWSLLNIPPQFRYKMHVIQLAAIARSTYVKQFGCDALLNDLCSAFTALKEGVELEICGHGKITYTGSLVLVLADTLAAQFLGGFKESVGPAIKPCRTCEISKSTLHDVFFAHELQLRDESEHRNRMNFLSKLKSKKAFSYWSRKWGVKTCSALSKIPDFELTSGLLHDPMHVILEGISRYELKAMLRVFVLQKKYFSLKFLNDQIMSFPFNFGRKDRPVVLDRGALERGSTMCQTAASMLTLLVHLPFLVGDVIPVGDANWQNFLRLLQVISLSLSPVASPRTINSLTQLIASHNFNYQKLYPEEPYPPKFHYLVHFPTQIAAYGPLRMQWCMRYEAKNGFFKQKRWHNFVNIAKSLAWHHQRWMCLNMLDNMGKRSEVFLYSGDEVGEGTMVSTDSLDISRFSPHDIPPEALKTSRMCVNGIEYAAGCVLLLSYHDVPEFVILNCIFVMETVKVMSCQKLLITNFDCHRNSFRVSLSEESVLCMFADLVYKWPQIAYTIGDVLHVMLQNCDDVWVL